MRPSRYYVTRDNVVVMASEVGVYDVDPADVVHKGRLKPGRMLLVDTAEHLIIRDEELKSQIAHSRPHSDWLGQLMTLDQLRVSDVVDGHQEAQWVVLDPRKQLTLFNYTLETLTLLLAPMFTTK